MEWLYCTVVTCDVGATVSASAVGMLDVTIVLSMFLTTVGGVMSLGALMAESTLAVVNIGLAISDSGEGLASAWVGDGVETAVGMSAVGCSHRSWWCGVARCAAVGGAIVIETVVEVIVCANVMWDIGASLSISTGGIVDVTIVTTNFVAGALALGSLMAESTFVVINIGEAMSVAGVDFVCFARYVDGVFPVVGVSSVGCSHSSW